MGAHTDGQTDRRADGQTNMTKLIALFRKYVKAPKKYQIQATNAMQQNVVPLRKVEMA